MNYLTSIKKSKARIERALSILSSVEVHAETDAKIHQRIDDTARTTLCPDFGLILFLYSTTLLGYAEIEKSMRHLDQSISRVRQSKSQAQPAMQAFLRYRTEDLARRCATQEHALSDILPVLDYRRSVLLSVMDERACGGSVYSTCECPYVWN